VPLPDVPPPPPTPPGYVYAATDIGPRSQEERDLCEKARHPDWIYLGVLALSDVASIYLDSQIFKASDTQMVRYLGPTFVGLSFGASIGGGYLALPKCSNTWSYGAPPEGNIRHDWPIAIALAAVSGAFAPMVFGTETGPWRQSWAVGERSGRLVVAGVSGVVGALIPYLIPPKTWRAAKEIENLRAGADQNGALSLTYTIRF
jgi:hypothetical protein